MLPSVIWAKKAASRGLLQCVSSGSANDLVQLALGVTLGHLVQADSLDLAGVAGRAEGFETARQIFLAASRAGFR